MNFDNVSIDLMSGLPYQNIKMLDESLEKFIELQIPHISVYNLIVEEGTKFYSLYENNELLLPSDDEDLEMYQLTRNKLTNAGYNQYEISNFAKKDMKVSIILSIGRIKNTMVLELERTDI